MFCLRCRGAAHGRTAAAHDLIITENGENVSHCMDLPRNAGPGGRPERRRVGLGCTGTPHAKLVMDKFRPDSV